MKNKEELPASNIRPHLKIISVAIFFELEVDRDRRDDERRADGIRRVAEETGPITAISAVVQESAGVQS